MNVPKNTSLRTMWISYECSAIWPHRHVIVTADIEMKGSRAVLHFRDVEVFRETIPVNEEAVLADLRERISRCLVLYPAGT